MYNMILIIDQKFVELTPENLKKNINFVNYLFIMITQFMIFVIMLPKLIIFISDVLSIYKKIIGIIENCHIFMLDR